MVTCTRRLTFCAGHRVYGHESKCSNLHGHNYVVEVTAEAELDSIGRVIDFSVIKELLGRWLEDNWDHGFVVFTEDDKVISILRSIDTSHGTQKYYIMPANPTAENMAGYLLKRICPMLFSSRGVKVTKIVLHETENCYATATLEDE